MGFVTCHLADHPWRNTALKGLLQGAVGVLESTFACSKFLNSSEAQSNHVAELFIGFVALHKHCPPLCDPFPVLAHRPSQQGYQGVASLCLPRKLLFLLLSLICVKLLGVFEQLVRRR